MTETFPPNVPELMLAGLTGLVNGAGLVFVFFFAHIAFAAGVATTIRAAIAAYILAALMGLVWVGLLHRPGAGLRRLLHAEAGGAGGRSSAAWRAVVAL